MMDATGWYPCPSGVPQQRYWDGRSWTQHTRDNKGSVEENEVSYSEISIQASPASIVVESENSHDKTPRVFAESAGVTGARTASSGKPVPGIFGQTGKSSEVKGKRPPGRRSLVSTFLEPFLLVPVAIISFSLVGAVGYGLYLVLPLWAALIPVAIWWMPAPFYFLPVTQKKLAALWFGCRPPTSAETTRLREPWANVHARAGFTTGTFQLMVAETEGLSAHAGGGSVIGVTAASIRRLESSQLEAALAHEMGHQLRRDMTSSFLHAQLMLPIRALGVLARALRWMVKQVYDFANDTPDVREFLLMSVFAVLIAGVALLIAIPWGVAIAVLALTRFGQRRTEYEADTATVELGLGQELLDVIELFVSEPEEGSADQEGTRSDGRRHAVILRKRAERLRKQLSVRQMKEM